MNIFWNQDEHRPRALVRLAGQVLLMILLLFICGALFGPYGRTLPGQGITVLIGIGGSVFLAAHWFDRRPIPGLGLRLDRDWWIDFGFGCCLGILLMAWIFGLQFSLGWTAIVDTLHSGRHQSFFLPFLGAVFLFLCVGVAEELWMRGYLIPNVAEGVAGRRLSRRSAVVFALLLAAIIFGLLHAPNPNASVISTSTIIFGGIVLGLPFIWTGQLAIPIGFHITWNISQGLLFGFPVSGSTGYPAIIVAAEGGPDWWTGGPFGPEAGMVGVGALLLGIALLYGWVAWRHGKPRVQESVADPPAVEQ